VPDLTNPFFGGLVHRIEELAAECDYQILLVGSNHDSRQEGARIQALLARRIDGLIVAPTRDDGASFGGLAAHLPPTVLIDRAFALEGFDTVAADNEQACYRGCRHLLELGHRDIALLATSCKLANMRERVAGYRRALSEAGAWRRERLVLGGFSVEGCRGAIEQELRRAARPTAVFAASYDATLGAIKAIRALDLAFPEDVSLLGFDDSDWMTALRPYVSAIVQPIEEMAVKAWRLLIARLGGEGGAPARVQLPCTLQIRESTRPPAAIAIRRRTGLA
jgi:LacI family transcriptional regulator